MGNFDGVFEEAYRTSYRPFLDVLEDYPEIPFALHTSGPLLEWLVDKHPEYIARAARPGRVGPGRDPGRRVLRADPDHDPRTGSGRADPGIFELPSGAVRRRVRGMWVAERVWEQQLVSAIVEAGIEYTVLDDFHFERAGCSEDDVFGYYLTEDDGRLLKVFPASETLRYSIPFQEPHETYEFLKELAADRPGSTVVFADDGEKFGSWPKTFDHVYTNGWLNHFCDMLRANRDWLETTTFARAVDSSLPLGKVYLPDGSYREMTEWALPPESLRAFRRGAERLASLPDAGEIKRFFRAGGYWRNFKARYPESDEMYARMLGVSRRLEAAGRNPEADPDYLEVARQELYRGQCNCPYWHGSFGGLYLPHLRNAIYRSLIAADNALDDAEGRTGPRVLIEVGDFNLDARQEVRLENDRLIAWVRPARGGTSTSWTSGKMRPTCWRRSTAGPRPITPTSSRPRRAATARTARGTTGKATHLERITFKQPGLDRRLVYDRYPRKALVDHFYPVDVSLDDLIACRETELGDFVLGTYLAKVQREAERVALVMERPGRVDGHTIRLRKTIELAAGSPGLSVHYELDDLPPVSVSISPSRSIWRPWPATHPTVITPTRPASKLGMLDARLDLPHTRGLTVTDQWLDLAVGLAWSQAAGLWCFPIETVSQSEGGIEGVYQSRPSSPTGT